MYIKIIIPYFYWGIIINFYIYDDLYPFKIWVYFDKVYNTVNMLIGYKQEFYIFEQHRNAIGCMDIRASAKRKGIQQCLVLLINNGLIVTVGKN